MISSTIEVICKSYSLFFRYAHLCVSLSRFRIGLPVCDNVFKELKCHQMRDFRSPSVEEMVHSYETVRSTGLTKVRLGNVGVFVHTEKDRKYLLARVDRSAY